MRYYTSFNYASYEMIKGVDDVPQERKHDGSDTEWVLTRTGKDKFDCWMLEHTVNGFNNHKDNDGLRAIHWDLGFDEDDVPTLRVYRKWPDAEGLDYITHLYEATGPMKEIHKAVKDSVDEAFAAWKVEQGMEAFLADDTTPIHQVK